MREMNTGSVKFLKQEVANVSIKLKPSTKVMLSKLGEVKDSYNAVVEMLIHFYKKHRGCKSAN